MDIHKYAKSTADYLNKSNDFTKIIWEIVPNEIIIQDRLIFCKNFIKINS